MLRIVTQPPTCGVWRRQNPQKGGNSGDFCDNSHHLTVVATISHGHQPGSTPDMAAFNGMAQRRLGGRRIQKGWRPVMEERRVATIHNFWVRVSMVRVAGL